MRKNIIVGFLLAFLFIPVISQAASGNQQEIEKQQELERQRKAQQQKQAQQKQAEHRQPEHRQPEQRQPEHRQPEYRQSEHRQTEQRPPEHRQLEHKEQQYRGHQPQHTYQQLHSRQEHFRQRLVNWRNLHPSQQPEVFTLNVGDRTHSLESVSPGGWYYNKSEPVNFVVPQGYVVVADGKEAYAGDSVNSQDFALFTEEAYANLDQEPENAEENPM